MPIIPLAGTSASKGALVPIGTARLVVGVTNLFQFTNIPQIYQDLQLVIVGRTSTSETLASGYLNFNSDNYGANTNYSYTTLQSTGVGTFSSRLNSQNSIYFGVVGAGSAPNTFGGVKIDILNYRSTANKTILQRYSRDFNGGGEIGYLVGAWRNTAAISTVSLLFDGVVGSTATLYGIRTVNQ